MSRNLLLVGGGLLIGFAAMPTSCLVAYLGRPDWIWLVAVFAASMVAVSSLGRTSGPIANGGLQPWRGDRTVNLLAAVCWISIIVSMVVASKRFGLGITDPAFLVAAALAIVALYQATSLYYSLDDCPEPGDSDSDV